MNTASYQTIRRFGPNFYPEDITGRVVFKRELFLDLLRLALRQMFRCFV